MSLSQHIDLEDVIANGFPNRCHKLLKLLAPHGECAHSAQCLCAGETTSRDASAFPNV